VFHFQYTVQNLGKLLFSSFVELLLLKLLFVFLYVSQFQTNPTKIDYKQPKFAWKESPSIVTALLFDFEPCVSVEYDICIYFKRHQYEHYEYNNMILNFSYSCISCCNNILYEYIKCIIQKSDMTKASGLASWRIYILRCQLLL